jgi:phosphatidylinositol alpha-1,6-mannosyltransferase
LGPHIQPNLIPSDHAWLNALNIPAEASVILSAARLVKRKGVDQLIYIFPQVVEKVKKPVMLVVAGDGPEATHLKQLAVQSGVKEKIIFTGQVTDEQLAELFQRCQLFVLPTREEAGGDVEGFGIVFLEANTFGKPVIGGKSGGVPDAVVDGLNGYLIEPTNLDMLLKAVVKLVEHPEVAERLGEQGKKRVVEQFDWQTNVQLLAKHLGFIE